MKKSLIVLFVGCLLFLSGCQETFHHLPGDDLSDDAISQS